MSPRGGQPRMVQQGQETRAALLDATSRVIARDGYAKANIRAIAAEAGVAVGTVFRHYPNKAALLVAALTRETAPVLGALNDLPERAGTATVRDNLTDVLTTLASLQELLVPFELAFLTDPELAEQRRQLAASAPDLPGPPGQLAAYLAAEQRVGRLRADIDPVAAAGVLLATLFGIVATAGLGPGPAGGTPIDTTVSIFLDGLSGS